MHRLFALGLASFVPLAPALGDPPSVAGRSAANATVALIDGWAETDGRRVAGIEITLDPAWHTYWRIPGEAGIPPTFDWSGSTNLAEVRYEWPRPEIIDSYGMRSFGYEGALVLPVLLSPKDPGAPMQVDLALSFGVCNDVCIQEDRHVVTRFAPGAGSGDGRGRIEAALAERARTPAEAGVATVSCEPRAGSDGYEVTATVTFDRPQPAGQVAVLETAQPGVWIGETASESSGTTLVARAPVAAQGGAAGPVLERHGLRLTVLDGRRAVDIRGCRAPG